MSVLKTTGIVAGALFLSTIFGGLYGDQTTARERQIEKTVPEIRIAALPTPNPEKTHAPARRAKNDPAPRRLIIRPHVVAPKSASQPATQDGSNYFVH